MKSLIALEEKRRTAESQLNEKEKKNVVKKGRIETRKKNAERRSNPYTRRTLRSGGESGDENNPTPGTSCQ